MMLMPTPADMPAIRCVVHIMWEELEPVFAAELARQGCTGIPIPVQGVNPATKKGEYLAVLDAENPDGDDLFDPAEAFALISQHVIDSGAVEGLTVDNIFIHTQGDEDGDVIVYLPQKGARPMCPNCRSRRTYIYEEHGSALETWARGLTGLVRQQKCIRCHESFLWDHAVGAEYVPR